MDKMYKKLFSEVTNTVSILAERVMDENHKEQNNDGLRTSTIMRDDYNTLTDKLKDDNFDTDNLTKQDYAKILVGVMLVVNNLTSRIENEQKAIDNYKLQIIPKLQRIINECETLEQTAALANELFLIEEK